MSTETDGDEEFISPYFVSGAYPDQALLAFRYLQYKDRFSPPHLGVEYILLGSAQIDGGKPGRRNAGQRIPGALRRIEGPQGIPNPAKAPSALPEEALFCRSLCVL